MDQPPISRDRAIILASEFVSRENIPSGDLLTVEYYSESDTLRSAGVSLGHGTYMVTFAYAGPPVKHSPSVVHTPALDSPVTIKVNDQSGETEVFFRL